MVTENLETGRVEKICLLDYNRGILERIFIDKEISKMLQESGHGSFQDCIDAFLESSDEDSMWILEEKEMKSARQGWSYDLPVEIVEAIKKIAEENSQEKSLVSIFPDVRG